MRLSLTDAETLMALLLPTAGIDHISMTNPFPTDMPGFVQTVRG